ncbi:hypothetical protein AN0188.2 [Aspergillus nidulans FGSC A4]|nr:hypothetical protein AN0188.2 [Aspergillus nidulans FGSC A4]|eukprot:XP_657792.1 hypothetical protein AN0188.2 [Aspergillus nidulans FGSC A4]
MENERDQSQFSGLPPFPDDVPTAPLLRLSLKDLLAGNETEIEKLSKACEDIGFFYLDMRDAGTVTQILEDADKLFEIGAGLFELPLEEKKKYDLSSQKSYFGYKAQGAAVVDRQGNLDRNEFYNVSKDDIMGISGPLPAPDIINKNRHILESFIKYSHSIVTLILSILNTSLGLPESTLTNIHRLHAVSGDQVRFVKAPPQPADDRRTALGEHTDFGSVTILFNRLGGLQVLPPGADAEWQYVKPLPGHVIVNLGDAMVKFTNGLLRSNIHRVVSPPGDQADTTRFSLVYFSRPEDDVPLRRLEGSSRIPNLDEGVVEENINSKDWIIRRALGRRVDVPDIEYDKSAGTEMLSRTTWAVRLTHGLLAPSALLYSVVSLSIYEARALPSLDGNMDMTYTFNEEDLASSVPGTPRSGLRTPPTSPLWSTGSAITTPGSSANTTSSGTTEYSHWQAEVFQPGSLTQAKRYHNNKAFQGNDGKPSGIEEKRYAFFASIRETVLPLLGADHSPERLFEIEESSHAQVTDYVLLDSQPTGIRATLKSYQLEGLSKMIYWRNNGIGGILADDMGLGKTLQALSLFQYVKDNERADSGRLGSGQWHTMEAVKKEKTCAHASDNRGPSLGILFTPIQNDLTELWSILHWLYPDVFVPATAKLFENAFSLTDGKFDSIFLSHITRFLKVVMLRRTKCDSQIGLDLPPKKETVFSVPLTELQLGWYRTILTGVDESILLGSIEQEKSQSNVVPMTDSIVESMTAAWETNKATNTKRRSHITTNTLMELRKCSIHPYLLADALPKEYNIGQHIVDASCKFIVLQKMIRQYVGLENKKVIIFSGFDQTLDLCEDLLEMEKAQFSFKYGRLDGSTSSAWRNLSVFLFQNDPRYMVFLLSTRAGGEGLNLVSSSIVIFLDDDWNPQVMRQAESRVHRIGQTQPVQIFRIHAKGTVEDQMRRRMDKKAYLADKVMGEFGNNITHHTDLEETTEDEICLIPSRPIIPRSFDAKDLVNSDFHSIMSSYALDEVSIQGMSHAEKRAWLARSERVKTNIFNGVMVETKYRRFSVYDETVLSISKASRRIGKSRVVTVGEWKVSKESMEMATPVSPTFPKQGVGDKACKMNEAPALPEDFYSAV